MKTGGFPPVFLLPHSKWVDLSIAVCFYLLMKKDFKHNRSVYLICYGIFRFCIEFLRADERGSFIGNISPSQFWSILMVVGGVGVYFLVEFLFKKRPKQEASVEDSEAVKE
jgi:phosphatidylglycerol:prolipoprotein diacylglycerol transferase